MDGDTLAFSLIVPKNIKDKINSRNKKIKEKLIIEYLIFLIEISNKGAYESDDLLKFISNH